MTSVSTLLPPAAGLLFPEGLLAPVARRLEILAVGGETSLNAPCRMHPTQQCLVGAKPLFPIHAFTDATQCDCAC